MIRRGVALVLLGLVPALTGCPVQPGSVPKAAPVAPAAPATSWYADMLGSVNAQRAAAGAPALRLCPTLIWAAQGHTADQAAHDDMTHTGSDGSNIGVRADRAGYSGWTALGENVAYGYTSIDGVMTGWMNSSGHRANILNASYTDVGFGQAVAADGTVYWTQDFGRSGHC
ncbi:MAG: CAP domain-containing protein [Acidimicrobiales bacterium]